MTIVRDVSGQALRPLYAAKDRHMVVNIRWLGNVVIKVMLVDMEAMLVDMEVMVFDISCTLGIASCLLLVS